MPHIYSEEAFAALFYDVTNEFRHRRFNMDAHTRDAIGTFATAIGAKWIHGWTCRPVPVLASEHETHRRYVETYRRVALIIGYVAVQDSSSRGWYDCPILWRQDRVWQLAVHYWRAFADGRHTPCEYHEIGTRRARSQSSGTR